MTQKKDNPAEPDPDATVTFQRSALKEPDEDATVMMPSRKAFENADEDATVMMSSRDALKEPDEDATVMMPAGGLKAALAAEEAAAHPQPAPAPAPEILDQPSRMPMMAGGLVVAAVILYFVFGGDKTPAPVAPAPAVATSPAPSTPPAATPAPAPAVATAATAAPGAPSKVADLLAADVKRGAVVVTEEAGRTTISLSDSNQFASGGVDPEAKLRPVLLNIAAALDKTSGAIVVIGHADANPSSNPKFPTNQALSAARAASAAKVMMPKLKDGKRLASEGAADSQPLGPSDTTANRAKNRRVVIVLKTAS